MQRMTSTLITALALCLGLAGAARAGDCDTVAKAYDALSKTKSYRETVTMPNMVTLEMVAIGDTLYMKQDLKWQKVDLKPGMRAQMMKRVIPDATALKDCSRIGTEAVGGLAATIYGYTPPPMEGAPAMGPQKVWIGDANGLPLKMTAVGADIALFYDDVKPPIP